MTVTTLRPLLRLLGPLLTAVSFLTRVPVPSRAAGPRGEAAVARSLAWFPLVGVLIGALVGGVQAVLGPVVNPLAAAAAAVAVGALVTGGFHEDGLADTADGFGGGWSADERLHIMKDPRHGTYGVLAICCSVAIRVAALASLSGWTAVSATAAVHLLARTWAVAALVTTAPARPGGLGAQAQGTATGTSAPGPAGADALGPRLLSPGGRPRLLLALAGWGALGLALLGPVVFVATAGAGALATVAVVVLARRKIGGMTGDVAGAVEQGGETVGLLALVGSVAGRGLW